jgi:hypothetical protein
MKQHMKSRGERWRKLEAAQGNIERYPIITMWAFYVPSNIHLERPGTSYSVLLHL